MPGRRTYDWLYRRGAPWEGDPREELVDLVRHGTLLPGRAIDLGCGSGANAIFLAENGFEVTGVDFSPVALSKARVGAAAKNVGERVRFVQGDLTSPVIAGVEGTFDLIVDYGTLDDLRGKRRNAMTSMIKRLSHTGSQFLMWCFYCRREELPFFRFDGPSRLAPYVLAPGEEQRLFSDSFEIQRLPTPLPGSGAACFLMTRR